MTPWVDFDELVIGNYQVLDRLGAGGMGTMYKAWTTIVGLPALGFLASVPVSRGWPAAGFKP